MKPARNKFTLLKLIVENIPSYLVPKLARKHGIDKTSRTFSPWSHVVSMIFAHLSHALSLNDVSDTLRHHAGALATLRNAQPPSRNGLSHANKVRDSEIRLRGYRSSKDYPTFSVIVRTRCSGRYGRPC